VAIAVYLKVDGVHNDLDRTSAHGRGDRAASRNILYPNRPAGISASLSRWRAWDRCDRQVWVCCGLSVAELEGADGDFIPRSYGAHLGDPSGSLLVVAKVSLKRLVTSLSLLLISTSDTGIYDATGVDLLVYPNDLIRHSNVWVQYSRSSSHKEAAYDVKLTWPQRCHPQLASTPIA